MQAMIGISLLVHLVLFMHIVGIYRSEALTYIELAMQDISPPPMRAIPRPRVRHQQPATLSAKQIAVQRQKLPTFMKDPVENDFSGVPIENAITPDSIEMPGLDISQWHGDSHAEYMTSNDYFDMLRLKIERFKKYPNVARARHFEGQATVRFVIGPDGRVSGLKIVKSARHMSLDQAALCAVKDAAPFAKPPANLFDESLTVEVTIMFELT